MRIKYLESQKQCLLLEKKNGEYLEKRVYKTYFEKKKCLYIISDHLCSISDRFKIGITNNIKKRLNDHRTCLPYLKIHFIIYTDLNETLESLLLNKFSQTRAPHNHEFINENLSILTNFVIEFLNMMNNNYTIAENINEYNNMIDYPSQDTVVTVSESNDTQ